MLKWTQRFLLLISFFALIALFVPQQVVFAATYTVTKTADTNDGTCDSDCSLREAIIAANANSGADTIIVPAGFYTLTITGTGENAAATGDLDITDAVTIEGAGSASTFIQACDLVATPGCTGIDRIFEIVNGVEVTIRDVTLRNGFTTGLGGGINTSSFPAFSTLTLENVVMSNNVADSGSFLGGGAIFAGHTVLTIRNSILENNRAGGSSSSAGGAIYSYRGLITVVGSTIRNNVSTGGSSGGNGGAFWIDADSSFSPGFVHTLTLLNSTMSGNRSGGTAGIGGSGYAQFDLNIINSTLTDNRTTGTIAGQNGAIGFSIASGTINIFNSTISDNAAGYFGGGALRIGPCPACAGSSMVANIRNSTIVNNTTVGATLGPGVGGLRADSGTFNIANSIISGNTNLDSVGNVTAGDCAGTLNSLGHNLFGQDGSSGGCPANGTTDIVPAGPLTSVLFGLANNGGSTLTYAPIPGSVVINAGNNANAPTDILDLDGNSNTSEMIPFDQRGAGFPRLNDANVDIGSIEAPPSPNQPPVITVPIGVVMLNEDSAHSFSGTISVSDPDAGSNPIQVTLSVNNGTLLLGTTSGLDDVTGDVSASVQMLGQISAINAALNNMVYVPDADYFGSDTLTITADDLGSTGSGGAQTDTDLVTLSIIPVNDQPSFSNLGDQTVPAGTNTPQSIPGWAYDFVFGPPNESTQSVLDFNVIVLTNPQAIFFTEPDVSNTGTLTFTPIGTPGSATVFVNLRDDGGTDFGGIQDSTPVILTITVSPNNPPAVDAAIADVSVLEDAADTTIDLYAVFSDAEEADSALTYTVEANTNAALFTSTNIAAGTLTLDYAPDANGAATLTVRATDSFGAFAEDVFDVNVTPVNDAPDFTPGTNPTLPAGTNTAQSIPGWASAFVFGPPDESTQSVVDFFLTVTSDPNGILSVAPDIDNAGTLTFTPSGTSGSATVDVRMQDDGGTANGGVDLSPIRTFTIIVSPNNPPTVDAPIADVNVLEDSPDTLIDLFAAFADAEDPDSALTFIVQTNTNPALFTSTNIATGTLTLDYAPDANGTADLTIRATDTLNGQVDDTFTVNVTPVNDAPDFTQGSDPTVLPIVAPQSIPNWASAFVFGPPDESTQNVLDFLVTVTNDPDGIFAVAPDVDNAGTLTFTPSGISGSATVEVRLQDDGGTANGGVDLSPVKTLIITVDPTPAITVDPAALPNGTVGAAYSQTVSAAGGTAPYTFTVSSGSLPDGLTLTGDTISGTPTTASAIPVSFTITATDANGFTGFRDYQIVIGTLPPPPVVAVATFPPPPPVPLCADFDGATNSIIRAGIPFGTVNAPNSVFCRVLNEDGVYVVPEGAPAIGVQSVIDQGVLQAVDVYTLPEIARFNNPITVCLQGLGGIVFLDAANSPRVPQSLPATAVGGYTCAQVPNAGTVVLVNTGAPPAGALPAAQAAPAAAAETPLADCYVTTNYLLNLRAAPTTESAVLTQVPFEMMLQATARSGGWLRVTFGSDTGWLNETYLALVGSCG